MTKPHYADDVYSALREVDRLRAINRKLVETMKVAEEYMTSNIPGDSWGLRDKGADADRERALAVMRTAIAEAEREEG